MKLKKIKQDSLRFVGHYLLNSTVNVLCKTLRISYINKSVVDDLEKQDKSFVYAFWHGTMLIPWFVQREKKIVALISKSKDGDLLARLLKHWDYQVVRGSSSVGGDVALGIMIDYAKNQSSIAITPDGPRGPIHKMKAGAVITAKKSDIPLVLVGVAIKKKKFLNSWDKFEVPLPFSKVNVIYSDPIYVNSKLNYDDTSKLIDECENKLNEIQNEAGNF